MSPLLETRDLVRRYAGAGSAAVDGVGFAMAAGTILGVVGESGCGKSTLARLVMALDRPTAGSILFDGVDLFAQPGRQLRALRRGFQMVFQDPYGSLDPRQRVGRIVAEPLHLDRLARGERIARVHAALTSVGLDPADAERHPHAFSGGQRQRIALARAIVGGPRLLVADEPVSALDPSVQAQILNLIMDLRDQQGIAVLLISHSLAVVETVADEVAVMYRGRFVETGPGPELFARPMHPYTMRLVAAEPRLDRPTPRRSNPTPHAHRAVPAAPSAACAYQERCPFAIERCRREPPALRSVAPDRFAACHRVEDIAA